MKAIWLFLGTIGKFIGISDWYERPANTSVVSYQLPGGKWAPYCHYGDSSVFKTNQLVRCIEDHARRPHWSNWVCAGQVWEHYGRHWEDPGHCWRGCLPCLRDAANKSAVWAHCEQRASVMSICNLGWARLGDILCADSPDVDELTPCKRFHYGQGIQPAAFFPGHRWPMVEGFYNYGTGKPVVIKETKPLKKDPPA